jgi:hypothetical protein
MTAQQTAAAIQMLKGHAESILRHVEDSDADPKTLAIVCKQTGELVLKECEPEPAEKAQAVA